MRLPRLAFIGVVAAMSPESVLAQSPVADFYKGKTITMSIGFTAGGEYDLQGRIVSRFIGRYIPGNPTVIATQMTGAGTITLANYLTAIAPKDGTQLGVISNGLPSAQATGALGVKYDARAFFWIGAMHPTIETHGGLAHGRRRDAGGRTARRRSIAGATSKGSVTYINADPDERAARHQVQARHRLPRRLRREPGDGARGGAARATIPGRAGRRPSRMAAAEKTPRLAYEGPRTPTSPHVPRLSDAARTTTTGKVIKLVFSGAYLGRPM